MDLPPWLCSPAWWRPEELLEPLLEPAKRIELRPGGFRSDGKEQARHCRKHGGC
jgi:hypothetical protein